MKFYPKKKPNTTFSLIIFIMIVFLTFSIIALTLDDIRLVYTPILISIVAYAIFWGGEKGLEKIVNRMKGGIKESKVNQIIKVALWSSLKLIILGIVVSVILINQEIFSLEAVITIVALSPLISFYLIANNNKERE